MANTTTRPGQYGRVSYGTTRDNRIRARARLALPDRDGPGDDIGGWHLALPNLVPVEGAGVTEDEALEALESAVRRRLVRHADEHAQATQRPRMVGTKLTVTELAREVVKARDALREKDPHHPDALRRTSVYAYSTDIGGHLEKSTVGKTRVNKVGKSDLVKYLKGLPVPVARRQRSLLNATFREAIERGFISSSPMPGPGELRIASKVSNSKSRIKRDRALSVEQQTDLLAKVKADPRAVQLDLVDLIDAELVLGARIGEITGLRWQDLEFTDDGRVLVTIAGTVERIIGGDLERGKRLVWSEPKTPSAVRTLPCPARLADLFRRRAASADVKIGHKEFADIPVFPAPGRWPGAEPTFWDRSNISRELRGLFDRCGCDALSFHGLRKSVVTRIAVEFDSLTASHWAGHNDPRVTEEHYVKRSTIKPEVGDLFA